MANENPIRTLGDYSKPSHEGYRNTIELPEGNNVFTPKRVPSFRWHRLWLQVQIFYDHVNPATRRTIDQSAGGKLRDRNAKESSALLEDLALYNNESLNDPRDFRYRWSRRIHLCSRCPEYIRPSSHRARKPSPTLDGSSSCSKETCYSEQDLFFIRYLAVVPNPQTLSIAWKSRQAFVNYASSRVDEARGKCTRPPVSQPMVLSLEPPLHTIRSNFQQSPTSEGIGATFMASQDARLSKFKADFKQQQSEMTNKINTVLKAITDQITGALPSDMVKNLRQNVNSTSPVLLLVFFTVGEGITRSVFRVKGVDLGEEEAPYWTTLGKRESYKSRPSLDRVGAQTLYYARKDFLDFHFPREWEISRDAELNPFKDVLVFRRMMEFLGAMPINLKSNMWESEDLIKNPINWVKPPKNGDGAWHSKLRLIDPYGEEFTKTLQSILATRKLSDRESPWEIIDLDHFYDT
ncbi:hypothetical protein Tco_0218859 [Tanacetum coccineum]